MKRGAKMEYHEFAKRVAHNANVPEKLAKKVIRAFSDEMIKAVKDGEKVRIPRLFSVEVSTTPAHRVKNPSTMEYFMKPEQKRLRFIAMETAKKQIQA